MTPTDEPATDLGVPKEDSLTRTSWVPPAEAPPGHPTLTHAGAGPPVAGVTVDSKADPTDPVLPTLGGLPSVAGFDVLEESGRGGMGVVYKARQYALNRPVALKMVLGGKTPTAEELIRFRLEAEVAARVRHPNVVQVFESGTHQGQPYLVMEWVNGGTLSDVLKSARLLPADTAARMAALLARAVHHAHAHGVVHRDLKPGNVLLAGADPRADGTTSSSASAAVTVRAKGVARMVVPKVTDFGLAKLTEGDMGLTQTGRVMGTPEFMAPEQAAGNVRDVGPAADVHALGVMLYQMVAGHTPFRGDNTYAVIKQVIEDEPKSLRDVVARVPADLQTICLKCLRKTPADRYPTAAAMADDLEAFLAGRPISARRVGAVERGWKLARRNPLLAGLAAACGLLLVGGFAGVTWQWRQAVAARGRAEAAEREAVDARRTAEAVNTFLIADMLASASPEKAQGRTITVLDVLDDAARRVAAGLPGEPAVEAGVRDALGRSYRTLGKPASAEPHLRRALAARTGRFGADHPDTLRTAGELALTLDDAGKWADAEAVFRDAEDRAVAALGKDHPVALDLRVRYALTLHAHGRSDEALALMTAAVSACGRVFGPLARETLKATNDLGVIRYERKELTDAARLLELAYTGRSAALGPTHPDTLESGNNLALVRETEGRSAEAEELLTEVVRRSEKVRGREHPDTLSAVSNLGHLLCRQRKYPEAAVQYRDALKAATDAPGLGAVHPLTLKFKHNLGTAQVGMKLLAEAEGTLGEVYRVRQAVLPVGHPDTLQAGHDLGAVLSLAGKPAAAFDRLGAVLTDRRTRLGDTHPDTVQTAAFWADVGLNTQLRADQRATLVRDLRGLWDRLRGAKKDSTPVAARLVETLARHELAADPKDPSAREHYLAGYHVRKELTRDQPEGWHAAASAAGQFVLSAGDAAAALPAAEDAVTAARRIATPDPQKRLLQAWIFAGQVALQAGQYEAAVEPLRELYECRTANDPDTYDHGVAANLYGRALCRVKRYDQAESVLVEGVTLLGKHRRPGMTDAQWSNRLAAAKADLVEAYLAQGKQADAEAVRAK